jgi:hypothetical protein
MTGGGGEPAAPGSGGSGGAGGAAGAAAERSQITSTAQALAILEAAAKVGLDHVQTCMLGNVSHTNCWKQPLQPTF